MVSAFVYKSSGPGLCPGQGHCGNPRNINGCRRIVGET